MRPARNAPLGVDCGRLKPAQEMELPAGMAPNWRDKMSIRKTLKFRLYGNRRNKHLHQTIDCAGIAWNHITALQRRYYRLTGRYAHKYAITKHMAKLRRRGGSSAYLKKIGSQALQDVCLRHDNTYQAFFKWVKTREGKRKGPSGFKKVKTYTSFTLTQAGWKFLGENRLRLGDYTYKFSESREVQGHVKTVTVKRDKLGHLWVCFSVTQDLDFSAGKTGEIAGFDYGLKDFLTDHSGKPFEHPQPFKAALKDIATLNRQLARKQKGSNGRLDAKRRLNKAYERVTNVRRDYFWKLANDLTDQYDVLRFETLNLDAMKRLWGRKVSDLAFGEFLHIVQHLCNVKGKTFEQIDRWNPSSQTHFECGHRQKLELSERVWTCQGCFEEVQRDHNAAKNIQAGGASPKSLDTVRRASPAGVA